MKQIALIILFSISLTTGVYTNTQASDLMTVINDFEQKYEWLSYRIAEESWEFYTTGKSDSLDFYNSLYSRLVSDEALNSALAEKNPKLDEDDLRKFLLVQNAVLSGKIEENSEISKLRDSLSQIDITYRAEFEGEKRTSNELYKIYRTDNNQSRRESAYRAWVSIGTEMQEGLTQLIKLRNVEASKFGFNNYFTLSLKNQGIDINQYMNLLRTLDSLTEQPYRDILQNTKGKLRITEPELWDMAYAEKNTNTKIDEYFPVDSQMKYIKRSLKNIGFNLDKLPIYFDLDSREGKSQFGYAFTIKAPDDMRVLANITSGIDYAKILMHEIGHTLHSAYIKQDDFLFSNTMIDGIWAEGMAQTLAALVNDKAWLVYYAHVPESVADAYLEAKKDADIRYLRITLLRLHFELEAYQNPQRDLNTLYWDLFEKYMMLPRHDDIYPWAAIIHYTTHPVYLHNYLYADMIAAQNIEFLKDNYETVVDNRNTKSFLVQNYFRFGAKYDWRDLLKRGTDSELDPKYLKASLGF